MAVVSLFKLMHICTHQKYNFRLLKKKFSSYTRIIFCLERYTYAYHMISYIILSYCIKYYDRNFKYDINMI